MITEKRFIYLDIDSLDALFSSESFTKQEYSGVLVHTIKCIAFESFGGKVLDKKQKKHFDMYMIREVELFCRQKEMGEQKITNIKKYLTLELMPFFLVKVEHVPSKICSIM
ncbi:MAG: hypothetical protein SP4CHLAM5_10400 [Chlamydiia bacterium]|nr:hypothetical protein [Chlamydiia bacterium]MCH9618897.1 hypothetical protein [Chlamydiia bacterium]MCH9624564.1 hypothetical protein [Chlamydiia bacterium]